MAFSLLASSDGQFQNNEFSVLFPKSAKAFLNFSRSLWLE
jgi:hypothetical protein